MAGFTLWWSTADSSVCLFLLLFFRPCYQLSLTTGTVKKAARGRSHPWCILMDAASDFPSLITHLSHQLHHRSGCWSWRIFIRAQWLFFWLGFYFYFKTIFHLFTQWDLRTVCWRSRTDRLFLQSSVTRQPQNLRCLQSTSPPWSPPTRPATSFHPPMGLWEAR